MSAYRANMPLPLIGIHFTVLPSASGDRKVRTIQGNIQVIERFSPRKARQVQEPDELVRLSYKDVRVSCADGEDVRFLYDSNGVMYELPTVRFSASFELGPVKSHTNWHFGWISAIEKQSFCLTYGDCGVVRVELPEPTMNFGDSSGLPWTSMRRARHACVPCPKESHSIVQVDASQKLHGFHPWTVRPDRRLSGSWPQLSKMAYSATVYTWLAAIEDLTDCLYVFETYQRDLSYEYEIVSGDAGEKVFQRLCRPQVGTPVKLQGNIEIPEAVLRSPDVRHASRHIFYPSGGGPPEILIQPAVDLFAHSEV